MKNFTKYLIESIDDDDFFSDLGYDVEKEITFLVDEALYKYIPETKVELQQYIKEHLDRKEYNLNDIFTGNIMDMSSLFVKFNRMNGKYNLSNIDISGWDVSNVEDMSFMFSECHNFNSDLSNWDVKNVTNMEGMFELCMDFNSDLSGWNVSNVTNMKSMFAGCRSFDSDLSNWNMQSLLKIDNIFLLCGIQPCNKPNFNKN